VTSEVNRVDYLGVELSLKVELHLPTLIVWIRHGVNSYDDAKDLVRTLQQSGAVRGAFPVTEASGEVMLQFSPIQPNTVERIAMETREWALPKGLLTLESSGSHATIPAGRSGASASDEATFVLVS
jgi:hypothetical protein